MTTESADYPQQIAVCDNCEMPVTEDDDYLSDDEGVIHAECNPDLPQSMARLWYWTAEQKWVLSFQPDQGEEIDLGQFTTKRAAIAHLAAWTADRNLSASAEERYPEWVTWRIGRRNGSAQ